MQSLHGFNRKIEMSEFTKQRYLIAVLTLCSLISAKPMLSTFDHIGESNWSPFQDGQECCTWTGSRGPARLEILHVVMGCCGDAGVSFGGEGAAISFTVQPRLWTVIVPEIEAMQKTIVIDGVTY
jgi:hypothetical protein